MSPYGGMEGTARPKAKSGPLLGADKDMGLVGPFGVHVGPLPAADDDAVSVLRRDRSLGHPSR